MANTFLNGLKSETNYTLTTNGGLAHKSTLYPVYDLFALGGAYRGRSDEDCIVLFQKAFDTDPVLAMKCLFYLRDCRGGAGERRFFRVVYSWLIKNHPTNAKRNLVWISEYGRWDDLIYITYQTSLWDDAINIIKNQLAADFIEVKTSETAGISLLAKWLPSENTSSAKTREVANAIRRSLGWSHRQYRKTLSVLRERINVLERLMSAGRWEEIDFAKIPSKAGLIYRNAFARRDLIAEKYKAFVTDEKTTVNAEVLNPVDIANQIFSYRYNNTPTETERLAWDKYWANLKDYYNGREENGIAIVDVSGSMTGQPMNAAVSMGAYIAERGKGPFANHFITFSNNPNLVEFKGVDIYDKFQRARNADWGMSTNIEATMSLILNTALKNHVPAEDMPVRLYIFSDMEFNGCITYGHRWNLHDENSINTLLEDIAIKWAKYGYELPKVIFWNLNARHDLIPALGARFSYVSGFSMNMIEQILSGKDGYELMLEKLNTERYDVIE